MLEPGLSLSLGDFVGSKVQSSNRTGLYLRENLCREFHDLQERHLCTDTEEPACERLLVLSFIRGPHSTDFTRANNLREF